MRKIKNFKIIPFATFATFAVIISFMTVNDELILKAAALLRASKTPTVLTGAGVSKESGIPTFRDALDGLWARYDPRQLANPYAFAQNPQLVWDFYQFRREMMQGKQPNPGHFALAELEKRQPSLLIITQNIDDLHEQAGSTHVVHLHGKIAEDKCHANCQGDPTLIDVSRLDWDRSSGPPKCPHCGAWVRPNVVWFGEILPRPALDEAAEAILHTDLMLVIGTSGVVSPAAEMPYKAKYRNARIIEINPVESEITPAADLWLPGPSGAVLPRVMAAL
jgi:NAD-dependent protein deacetylase/lipoamidase